MWKNSTDFKNLCSEFHLSAGETEEGERETLGGQTIVHFEVYCFVDSAHAGSSH